MGKSKKTDVFGIVIFAVLVLSLVMAIVGVCIAWTSSTATVLGKESETVTNTLADLAKSNADAIKLSDKGLEGFGVMQAFAYITVALAALTAVVFVLSKFAKIKVLKWILIAVSALLVISAIVTVATTYGFCGKYSNSDLGVLASAKTVPAAGAWLLTIFGIVGGASGVVGSLKK